MGRDEGDPEHAVLLRGGEEVVVACEGPFVLHLGGHVEG